MILPTHTDPVLLAALETRERAWGALWRSLEDRCHVTIQRACIAEWVEADDRVKKLLAAQKEKERCLTSN